MGPRDSTKRARLCKKQFFAGNRKNYIMTLVTVFVGAGTEICVAFILKSVTEAMQYEDFGKLKLAIILTVSAAVTSLIISVMQKTFRNKYMKRGLAQFKNYVFGKLFMKSIGDFADTTSAQFISAFSNDLQSIESHYLTGNISLVNQAVMFCGAVAAMAFINWRLCLCVMLVMILPFSVALKYGNKLTVREKQTSAKNAGFVDQVKDLLNGFIVIKSFKAEKEVLDIFTEQNYALEEAKRSRRETSDIVGIISGTSSTVVLIVTVIIGTFFVFKGIMTIGGVLAFVQLLNYVLGPIRQIIPLWSNRKAAVALIAKLADSIEIGDGDRDKEAITRFDGEIEYRNVSFSYDGDNTILNGVSLKLQKGKSYAIVGGSGGGKSTLLRLLMGHFDGYSGEILIDGRELRTISLDSLYDIVSVIQQSVFLFDSSIKNNITMFRDFPKEKYDEAIGRAGLAALIAEKGEDYECGAQGNNLSGGEKQRVSIARCLIRETPLLLMDEATAALDNATAWAVDNAILDISGLTRIIVTHRFDESILRKYDEIIAVNKGDIVETGSFDELMSRKGYFYSLYNVSQC